MPDTSGGVSKLKERRKTMIEITYLERHITQTLILDFDDIMEAVEHFKACVRAKIEHGDITYISATHYTGKGVTR